MTSRTLRGWAVAARRVRGPARGAFGGDGSQPRRHCVHVRVGRDADGPAQPHLAETSSELGANPVAAVGEHVAEHHAGRNDALDLVERDLPLRTKRDLLRYAALTTTRLVLGPRLGQVQPQRHPEPASRHAPASTTRAPGSWHSCRTARSTDAHAYRMRALLHQRRVVDDQVRVSSPDQRVGLVEQDALVLTRVPRRRRDEVMELLLVARALASRHRLDALALPRRDGPRKYTGAQRRCPLWPNRARKGRIHRSNSASHCDSWSCMARPMAHTSRRMEKFCGGVVLGSWNTIPGHRARTRSASVFLGGVRRECLDHILVLAGGTCSRSNESRPHQWIGQRVPPRRAVRDSRKRAGRR